MRMGRLQTEASAHADDANYTGTHADFFVNISRDGSFRGFSGLITPAVTFHCSDLFCSVQCSVTEPEKTCRRHNSEHQFLESCGRHGSE